MVTYSSSPDRGNIVDNKNDSNWKSLYTTGPTACQRELCSVNAGTIFAFRASFISNQYRMSKIGIRALEDLHLAVAQFIAHHDMIVIEGQDTISIAVFVVCGRVVQACHLD